MNNHRSVIRFWLIVVPNLALFYLSLWITIQWRYPQGLSSDQWRVHLLNFSTVHILWLLTFLSFRLFDREAFRRYTTLFFSLFSAMFINLLLAMGYFYLQPQLILTPRRFLLLQVGLSFILILLWDLLLKTLVFSRFIQPVYLFTFNEELKYLEEEIGKHSYLGFRVRGHIDKDELNILPAGAVVIFPNNLHADPSMADMIFSFRNRGIIFYSHNNFYENLLRRIFIQSLDQIWFLHNINYQPKFFYNFLKRVFDLSVGLMLFCFFLISLPLCVLLIKLTSPGPVLFEQPRIGKDGKIFNLYKYRSMSWGTSTNTWTERNDARITWFGKILRLTRLDELPQSINLLAGNMSIVGPRPEQVDIVEELKKAIPFYEERHIVKPGITGWAQLNIYARNLDESKLKLEYDLYYVKHQSLLFDLEIIAKTAFNILTLQGK